MTKSFKNVLVLASALLLLQACATDPVTGKRTFAMSEAWEIKQGQRYHQEILKQYEVYDDPELQAYVDRIGQRLAAKSHRSHLKFTFTLLDSPEVNAFALPGGYIYITRGIMSYMSKESHLAGVIGHEIGHVSGLHGAERAVQQQASQIATVAVAVGSGSGELVQASQQLGGALISGYGRQQELESDRLGAEYIAKNNYSPDDMIDVIGILKNQELFAREKAAAEGRTYQGYHGLFSTHPRNDQRLQEVIKAAERYRNTSKPIADTGEFLRLTDGMAYGDSERQGVTQGNKFYHRGLDLYLEFPKGWRLKNTPAALGAISADGTQIIQMAIDSVVPPVDAAGYLRSKFSDFRDGRRVNTGEDQAVAGVVTLGDTNTGKQQNARVSIVTRGGQAFVFTGRGASKLPNKSFFDVVESVRRLKPNEDKLAQGKRIKLVTAKRGDTVAKLAKRSNLNSFAQAQIRLINNLYPSGEPEAGQKIKIIE